MTTGQDPQCRACGLMNPSPQHDCVGDPNHDWSAAQWKARAEKAEAELARWRMDPVRGKGMTVLVAKAYLNEWMERAKNAESQLHHLRKADARPRRNVEAETIAQVSAWVREIGNIQRNARVHDIMQYAFNLVAEGLEAGEWTKEGVERMRAALTEASK